jgi:membrane protein required for colicin V production
MATPSVDPFDAVVYLCLAAAIIAGFFSGLVRSLATIFGYLVAAPVAVALMPYLSPVLAGQFHRASTGDWLWFTVVFAVIGIAFGAVSRMAVNEIVGPTISAPDRLAGAMLGAVRIGLVAVLIVLIFDRLIPPGREPDFLKGSRLRPILSQAAQQGLSSLPPDVETYIDRLKRERRL